MLLSEGNFIVKFLIHWQLLAIFQWIILYRVYISMSTLNILFFQVKLTFDLCGNGGWRPNGYVITIEGCEKIVNTLGETLREIKAHTTPPKMGKCPIPPVNNIKNFLIIQIEALKDQLARYSKQPVSLAPMYV